MERVHSVATISTVASLQLRLAQNALPVRRRHRRAARKSDLQPPIVPKSGRRIQVLGIARISTDKQDEKSLQDQEALYREFLDRNLDLPYDLTMIASEGSGEALDRAEVLRAHDEVEAGRFDLVILEDLGRLMRRAHAQIFCEHCEDHRTRLIAINDHLDTALENWRVLASVASMRHEMHNSDVAKRIRRTLRNRFTNGGIIQFVIFGYIKPPGAKSDSDLRKDPAAEPIIAEIIRQLEDGASYGEVADWLNERGILPGPYARAKRWTGPLVSRFIHNPLLKGLRVRNRMMSKRVNKTGRRKSIKAPLSERLERYCPHLAFLDADRYDRLIAKLDGQNAHFGRSRKSGIDCRANVPRKRTTWPGQHIRCGVCGRPFYWGGHGQVGHMMCSGARDYLCWTSATFDGHLASQRLSSAVLEIIKSLPDFDLELRKRVETDLEAFRRNSEVERQQIVGQLTACERNLNKLVKTIELWGGSPTLENRLRELESFQDDLRRRLRELDESPKEATKLPPIDELKQLASQAIERLAGSDPEFGRAMLRLIERLEVVPVRLLDGGALFLRAKVKLNLAAFLSRPHQAVVGDTLKRTLTVDLFDSPQRAAFRKEVVALRASGMTEREVAAKLCLTITAAQRAMSLHRLMIERGVNDPYELVTAPPVDSVRIRRHKHPRYRFEPLDGYPSY